MIGRDNLPLDDGHGCDRDTLPLEDRDVCDRDTLPRDNGDSVVTLTMDDRNVLSF